MCDFKIVFTATITKNNKQSLFKKSLHIVHQREYLIGTGDQTKVIWHSLLLILFEITVT